MADFSPRVRAVLGPTNTGKTHLAIERLLAHRSGIIGFPLRLLARENYDRMVAAKGARHVALITGEEKIIPPEARWFSCTVEAMPPARLQSVEFVAVDEIQLCADPDRGHVFTERLLGARGLVETMFLGAETIRPLLQRLVPQAVVETRPRLSQLVHAGPTKLARLPPRTAIVAFSAEEVYALAETIRRRRGGCAVVMGRLSPRTRNAQVALYQAKEVDYLVATDAIGMGLNMAVDHVAFAGLGKFDGHRRRPLGAAELGQIAGRAGRGMRDGSFGTTGTCPPLDDDIARAVEDHVFEPLGELCWRNDALDFSSVEALIATLAAPPPRRGLVRGNDAADLLTLIALARDAETHRLATGPARVRLLWEACQIPDFRKLADDSHMRLCARVFSHLVREGRLPEDWLAGQIESLARTEGDIDTLMARLAGIRVWAFIAARADWLRNAVHWQERARAVEDRLSDALHERLLARFVDRRASHLMRRLESTEGEELLAAVTRAGAVLVEGHEVGHVAGLTFHPDPDATADDRRLVLRAARRALGSEMPRRVAALTAAADADFIVASDGQITWDGVPVGRLARGAEPLRPRAEPLASEFLDGPQREAVRQRLQRVLDTTVQRELAPLFAAAAASASDAALRGPLHRLFETLGIAPGATATDGAPIGPALRGRLRALGVRAGQHALFMPALLKPGPQRLRGLLWAVDRGISAPAPVPPGRVAIAPPTGWPEGFAAAMGWVAAGPVLLRLDIAERVGAELARQLKHGPAPVPAGLASRLSVKTEHLSSVLRGLGFALVPAAACPDGGPALLAAPAAGAGRARAHRRPVRPPPPQASGPFAALAALRR